MRFPRNPAVLVRKFGVGATEGEAALPDLDRLKHAGVVELLDRPSHIERVWGLLLVGFDAADEEWSGRLDGCHQFRQLRAKLLTHSAGLPASSLLVLVVVVVVVVVVAAAVVVVAVVVVVLVVVLVVLVVVVVVVVVVAAHCSLLTTHYSPPTTHYSLLTTSHLPTTHYSLLTTHYSLLTPHSSLFTTHYYTHYLWREECTGPLIACTGQKVVEIARESVRILLHHPTAIVRHVARIVADEERV